MILNKALSFFGLQRKESRTWPALIGLGLNDTAVWTPRDYERLTRQAYALNADVFSCINLIASCAKQVPWIGFERLGGAEARPNTPAGQYLKLLQKPNERDTGQDFIEACISYLLLTGNSYIERSGGTESTPPAFLYPHRPDRMVVIKGSRRNLIAGYEYKAAGTPIRFQPWEVMHLRLFNPLDDYYGMSPLEAALYTIDCSNESRALYKKLLQRGFPPGAISVEGEDWTDDQIVDFKKGYMRATEKDNILYLGNAKWQPMGFRPVDASLFEGRKYDKRDIAAVFKVPAGLIGDTTGNTYANIREYRRSLYTEAVLPALIQLRDGLNAWLGPVFGNAYIDIDKDAIDALAEDREVQSKRIHLLWTSDLITRNEGRDELKYDKVPDAEDGYYSELVKQPDPDSDGSGGISDDNSDTRPVDVPVVDRRPRRTGTAGLAGIGHENGSNNGFRLHRSLNLISEEEKDNHWKAFESERERWYARIAADTEDRFHSERNSVLKAFRDGGETPALRAVTREEGAWTKLYRTTYLNVSEDFGRRVLRSFKSDGYEMEAKFAQDLFTRTVLEWLATEGAKRVVGVLDTTKEKIRRELAAGILAGEGTFELSKRLEGMYEQFSLVRAERVARTEVISASNLGSQTAARSTNLPLEKSWLATFDNRTRDPHAAAHGQKKPISEPYTVAGQSLMFPGDSSLGATADNLIQCRCAESYQVARG